MKLDTTSHPKNYQESEITFLRWLGLVESSFSSNQWVNSTSALCLILVLFGWNYAYFVILIHGGFFCCEVSVLFCDVFALTYLCDGILLQYRPSSAYNTSFCTTNSGLPVWNNNSALTVGTRGIHFLRLWTFLFWCYYLCHRYCNGPGWVRIGPGRVLHQG